MSQPVTTTSTALAEPASAALAPVGQTFGGAAILFDETLFNRLHILAEVMASGSCTVPKHLQGKVGDCFAVASQAMRWGMDPYAVAQKTHIVNGTLGYEAQLVSAVIHARGPIQGRLSYEWTGQGENLECTVSGLLNGETEPRTKSLKMSQVGTRNSPLWKTDPAQQLAYLATKYWSRLYCPDVILGVYSPDELSEFGPDNARDVTPPKSAAGKLDAFGSAPAAATASGPVIEGDAKPAAPKSEKTAKTFRLVTPDGEVKEWGKAGDWLADFRSHLGAASDPETYWDNNMEAFAELQAATSKNEQAAAAFREGYAEAQAAIAAHGSPDL